MDKRTALIIDTAKEVCLLMCHHLSKRGFESYYAESLADAVKLVASKRPDIIVADKHFHSDLESSLHHIIDSSDDYDPDVFLVNMNFQTPGILDDILK